MTQEEGSVDSPMRLPPRFRPGVLGPPLLWQAAQFKPAGGNHPKPAGYFAKTHARKFVVRRHKRLDLRKSGFIQHMASRLKSLRNVCTVRRIEFEGLVMKPMLDDMVLRIFPQILHKRAAAFERIKVGALQICAP